MFRFTCMLLFFNLPFSSGFSLVKSPTEASHSHSISSTTRRFVGMTYDNDEDYFLFVKRANECAHSEECSMEESQSLLNEIHTLPTSSETDPSVSLFIADIEESLNENIAKEATPIQRNKNKSTASAKLLPWTPALVSQNNWSVMTLMLIGSTFQTVTAPHDEIVMRVGWAFQDWNSILDQHHHVHNIPVLIYAAALYMALSEIFSSFLPESEP